MELIRKLLHLGVFYFQTVRRIWWYFSRPQKVGVHGIPLTPGGKIILVTLSYAPGWRLPGGGQKNSEDGNAAMLRELREEIGLTAYESIDLETEFQETADYRNVDCTLFVIRGVQYTPRWSLEIKAVGEFRLDSLPPDTADVTLQLLRLAATSLAN
jgi:8-oxo-dGTP pyrophosphatase MutT (NUDIX family)